ncbi:peptide ABC transporter substrate-binding protein [Litorilinea aerophila]|uniref:Peptide ABC transporter substrate-binding protein n=1 Tax=Litorilinea aerophila TaxID=1204385 RepID=A0A540VGL5_9CHLR|nr:peptide ABC transporter substrate-binding protein [Litorilinea aerophila]MCC9077021.1 peptide ABC transporter substrate-binding protein [Litorilinea aerophila]GIV76771.1 MAG: ABC transporter substrate-binding protein [Litorilinea sp.]
MNTIRLNWCLSGRRAVWTLLALLTLVLVACQAPPPQQAAEAPAEPTAQAQEAGEAAPEDAYITVFGERLPEDAVPYDQQVYREPCDITANQTTFDFMVAVYQRFCAGDSSFSLALVDLDKDFNVIPMAAESWEVSEDGLTWTFHIRPGMIWSDDTPVTAHDWVATYRYAADPEHAWDFAWFYSGVIKNWDEVIAGELPVEELGVQAVDDLTLQITTYNPFPPLPGMMHFAWPLQAKALEEHGPYYNNDPATSVSMGRFKLVSMEPGKRIVLEANEKYKGPNPPYLKRREIIYMDPSTYFAAFQNGEIDAVGYEQLTPADFDLILNDPVLSANYLRHYGDFRTDYLLFDTFTPPFNDLNVRKAFAHAVDRESIVKNVYGEIKAMPAYSMLMPGFPSSDTEGKLKEYQMYDCELAQQYLADAGYPNGEGFPKLEMWLRNESPALQAVFQAVAASISECLNIQIEVSNKDYKVYMDALNAKPTQLKFGAISYGMDYLDPSNLLGIWVSTGRHSWKNDEFDRLIREATPLVGDPEKRDQMFREAERILVDDVGGVFIAHRWQGTLYQPYVQGEGLRTPDSNGIAAWHWGNDWVWGDLYIAEH